MALACFFFFLGGGGGEENLNAFISDILVVYIKVGWFR